MLGGSIGKSGVVALESGEDLFCEVLAIVVHKRVIVVFLPVPPVPMTFGKGA